MPTVESVTIHADASWSGKDKKGGWAVWIKCETERIVRQGECPEYVIDNNEAELAAIYAGLYIVSTRSWFKSLRVIYIRSDSQTALGWIRRNDAHRKAAVRLLKKIREVVDQIPHCRLDLKHTPGHSNPKKSVANYVNSVVDQRSREARLGRSHTFQPAIPREPARSPASGFLTIDPPKEDEPPGLMQRILRWFRG